MKPAELRSTILFVGHERIARADLAESVITFTGPRAHGSSLPDAVAAALKLGKEPAREVWVLGSEVWHQTITLNAAQIAGLTPEQLGRALSFEVEPFSGIPVDDSAIGFLDEGAGAFSIVQSTRNELSAIARAVTEAGGRLGGITHVSHAPEDEAAFRGWCQDWPVRLKSGAVAMIAPPAPLASPHRFLLTGAGLAAVALVILVLAAGANGLQRKFFEGRNAEFTGIARQVEAANKQNDALRRELAEIDQQQDVRDHVQSRRGAVLALLKSLAAVRPDDVLVRGLQAEGPSTILVSGISLEAGAVDELSIILTQSLRTSGWTAQPRSKTGQRDMPNGGPWEFTLALVHEEEARANLLQLSQRETP